MGIAAEAKIICLAAAGAEPTPWSAQALSSVQLPGLWSAQRLWSVRAPWWLRGAAAVATGAAAAAC